MLLARISGTVTATIKVDGLQGHRLLVADLLGPGGDALTASLVVADSLGAGIGDTVLLVTGSAVRQQSQYSGCSIDACTVAIVDQVARPDGFTGFDTDASTAGSGGARQSATKPATARKISARKTAARKTSAPTSTTGTARKATGKKKQSKSRARKTS